MSKQIDQRVVEMQFDNRHFEKNVKSTMSMLDKLKKSLNLTDSAKGFDQIESSAKKVNMSGLADAVDTVRVRFSALQVIALTALQNITNSVINTGKQMLRSLTIDPVKEGFQEYELVLGAIQTTMAGTGKTMEEVEKQLVRLDKYADDTIYSTSDMLNNLPKFTNAGVELEKATTAMIGIANATALAGGDARAASSAFYNLGQSIGTGYLTRMDYNSINNAGIATMEWKNHMVEAAIAQGKLTKTGEDAYKAGKKTYTLQSLFIDGLQEQWASADVMMKVFGDYGDVTTDIGKRAQAAAQDLRSFTMMMESLQATAGTGWKDTWQILFGNLDEAKSLWTALGTAIGDSISESAEARNELLQYWKDNGGRIAIIEGLAKALTGLATILEPIEEAFRDIFPKTTGQMLVEMSENFRDLMANFKIGDETADKLKRTFKGFFAILDIGKQALSAIAGGLGSLIKYLSPAGSGFLSITANIGDFFVKLNESIKATGIFKVAIEKIGDFMNPIAEGVKKAVSKIFNAIKSFKDIDTSGIDSFSERVKVRFEPFTKLGEMVHTAFTKIVNIVKKTSPIFYNLANIIGSAFEKLTGGIIESLDNADFNSIFDIINGGLLATILVGMKKFIKSLTEISDGAGGFLSGITGILDGVKGSLEAFQSQLKAGTLLKIASAIAILAAALIALSLIDSEKLTSSLVTMTAMFAELFGSMAVFQKTIGTGNLKGLGTMTTAMIGMSVAIVILSGAMTKLATLDWDGITKGLIAVGTLTAMLVQAAKSLSNSTGSVIKGAAGFVIFAAAILVLSSAVQKLGDLDANNLTKGLVGVGVLVTELALFMKATDLDGMGINQGVGILALASAILVLSTAVTKFSEIDTNNLIKGLTAVGVVLAELAIFVKLTGDSKKVTSTAIGLTILGAAMLIFASAVSKMGSLPGDEIVKGLVAMGGALTIITSALNFMPKNMILIGTGLVAVAGALVIMSNALLNMGGMSWEGITKGIVTLAGSLTIISVAMLAMQNSLPGAAALLTIAGSLAILAPVLQTLGSMSISEIGKGLLSLAGVFTVMGVAGLVLGPLTPVILGLAGAIALLGVGCVAIGAGLLAFSAGLSALAVAGTAGSAALVVAVMAIVGLIPAVLTALAEGIVDFIKVLGRGAKDIAKAVVDIVIAIVEAMSKSIPVVVETLYKLLGEVLKTLVEYIPQIVDAGMKIIHGFLRGIADNIQNVIEAAIDIMVNFIKGIASKLPDIIQAGIDLILSFINGIADGIRNNTDAMIEAMENLMGSMIEAGGKVLRNSIEKFTEIGKNIVTGLINGIKSMITSVGTAAKDLGTSVLESAKKALGIHSPSKLFKQIGENIGAGLTNGINGSSGEAEKASEDMSKKVTNASSNVVKKSNESAKKAFDKAVAWIDERKYYNKLSLKEELIEWEKLQKRYAKGSDERKKADREVYRVKNEIQKKIYNDEIQRINDLKYFGKMTQEEELAAWTEIQKKYKKGSDERKQADKEVYRLKKELIKQEFDDEIDKIDNLKYYNKLTLEEELLFWQDMQKEYKKGSDERIRIEKEIYRVTKEVAKDRYDKEMEWIDERKYYNQLSLTEELQAWKRIQSEYLEGTEERKKANREVYRIQNEINSATLDYEKQVQAVHKNTIEQKKRLEDEYYAKVTEINNKLKQDIQSVNEEYEKAIDSRTKSLYSAYGLFDKVEQKDPIDGKELITNLKDQVSEFEDWQENITKLSEKAISKSLLKELTDMGPKSLSQIKALNELSEPELEEYVSLWQTKYDSAKQQATNELEEMRISTISKIAELNSQAAKELEKYRNIWRSETRRVSEESKLELKSLKTNLSRLLGEFTSDTEEELVETKDNVVGTVKELREETEEEVTTLTDNIQSIIERVDWYSVGANIVRGITNGITSNASSITTAASNAARAALNAANVALGIKSPSKEFEKVGKFADEGLAGGLRKYVGYILDAGQYIGNAATNSLSNAISKIAEKVSGDMDMSPIIRPVLDLTDIESGSKSIASMLGGIQGIDVSGSVDKASSISTQRSLSATETQKGESSQNSGNTFEFTQNNYSPKALSRVDIYRQTKNQFSAIERMVEA